MSKIDYSVPPIKPWKNDIHNSCAKCGTVHYLQVHHVTYTPEQLVYLCVPCHGRITGLNTKGSLVAGGNMKTRTEYTVGLRLVLWDWYMQSLWPTSTEGVPVRRMSKTRVRKILEDAEFKIIKLSGRKSKQCCLTDQQLRQSHTTTQPHILQALGLTQ